MPRSFAVEVQADSTGNWAGNGCRYPSRVAAEWAARELEIPDPEANVLLAGDPAVHYQTLRDLPCGEQGLDSARRVNRPLDDRGRFCPLA